MNELNQRLEQLRASRRQLRNLMEQAETNSEQWQVETALSQAEAEAALATLPPGCGLGHNSYLGP